jgi:hypothetical protein
MDSAILVDFLPFTTVGTFRISRVRLGTYLKPSAHRNIYISCVISKEQTFSLTTGAIPTGQEVRVYTIGRRPYLPRRVSHPESN